MASSDFRWTNRFLLTNIADRAAKQAATVILSHATAVAPRDTGNLARSIVARRDRVTQQQVRYVVGTNVFYAPFVEFGTRRMAAQPFLGPALEVARRRFGGR